MKTHREPGAERRGSWHFAAVPLDSRDLTLTELLKPPWPHHGVYLNPDLIIIPASIPHLFDHTCFYMAQ